MDNEYTKYISFFLYLKINFMVLQPYCGVKVIQRSPNPPSAMTPPPSSLRLCLTSIYCYRYFFPLFVFEEKKGVRRKETRRARTQTGREAHRSRHSFQVNALYNPNRCLQLFSLHSSTSLPALFRVLFFHVDLLTYLSSYFCYFLIGLCTAYLQRSSFYVPARMCNAGRGVRSVRRALRSFIINAESFATES